MCRSILLLAFCAALPACGDDDGDPDRDGADAIDAADAADSAEAGDTADALPAGAHCASNMSPGCGPGLLCVQTMPPYCSGDYGGTCEAVPSDCAAEPDAPVCDCGGNPYRNACEARLAGVGTILGDCP